MAHRGTVRSKVASEQNFPFPHRTANDVPSGDNEASLRGIFIAEAKEVNPLAQEGFEAGKDSHNDAGQKIGEPIKPFQVGAMSDGEGVGSRHVFLITSQYCPDRQNVPRAKSR